MTTDAVYAATTVILLGIVIWRRDMMLRRQQDRSLWSALALLSVAVPLYVGPLYRAVDDLIGVPGSAATIRHGLAVLAALAVLTFVTDLTHARPTTTAIPGAAEVTGSSAPPAAVPSPAAGRGGAVRAARARRRFTAAAITRWWPRREVVGCVVALTVMIAPFVVAPPEALDPALVGRAEYYDTTWRSLCHWGAYLGFMWWSVGAAAAMCHRVLDHAAAGRVRTGLLLVRAGTTIGLAYLVLKAAVALAWAAGTGPATVTVDYLIEAVLLSVALTLIAVGSAFEAVSRAVHRSLNWVRLVRSLWALYPLWRVIYQASPHIARLPPGSVHRLNIAPMDPLAMLLVDRVVEIRDGLLDLRAYARPQLRDRAHALAVAAGASPRTATAVAEAVSLEVARRAKARGDDPRPDTHAIAGDTALLDDGEWLQRVATAHRRSPLVRHFAATATHTAADATATRPGTTPTDPTPRETTAETIRRTGDHQPAADRRPVSDWRVSPGRGSATPR